MFFLGFFVGFCMTIIIEFFVLIWMAMQLDKKKK